MSLYLRHHCWKIKKQSDHRMATYTRFGPLFFLDTGKSGNTQSNVGSEKKVEFFISSAKKSDEKIRSWLYSK